MSDDKYGRYRRAEEDRHQAGSTVLPFGKYKGRRLRDTPDGYLSWLMALPDLSGWLRAAVGAELAQRARDDERGPFDRDWSGGHGPGSLVRVPKGVSVSIALQVVEQGRRSLALRWHPDVAGGNTAAMQSVNAAADWLSELLGELAEREEAQR